MTIVDGIRQADADDEVRVVILSGRGRAFSAGGDRGLSPEERAAMKPAAAIDTGLAIWNCRKPIIAAVQGYCLGQGAEIAAICDLTIAADDAASARSRSTWGPARRSSPRRRRWASSRSRSTC